MFTIKDLRAGDCNECQEHGQGVLFVLEHKPNAVAFLCWKHFRLSLEAMKGAGLIPAGGAGAFPHLAEGTAPGPSGRHPEASAEESDAGAKTGDRTQENESHSDSRGGTDHRETGGEG